MQLAELIEVIIEEARSSLDELLGCATLLSTLEEGAANEGTLDGGAATYADFCERAATAAQSLGLAGLSSASSCIGEGLAMASSLPLELRIPAAPLLQHWPDFFMDYLAAWHQGTSHSGQQARVDTLVDRLLANMLQAEFVTPLDEAQFAELRMQLLSPPLVEDQQAALLPTFEVPSAEALSLDSAADAEMEVMDGFLSEGPAQIDRLAGIVADLVRGRTSPAQLELAHRTAHTLKGTAAIAGVRGIATLAHALEDILEAFGRDDFEATRGLKRVMTAGCDQLELALDHLNGEGPVPDEFGLVTCQLYAWACQLQGIAVPSHLIPEEPSADTFLAPLAAYVAPSFVVPVAPLETDPPPAAEAFLLPQVPATTGVPRAPVEFIESPEPVAAAALVLPTAPCAPVEASYPASQVTQLSQIIQVSPTESLAPGANLLPFLTAPNGLPAWPVFVPMAAPIPAPAEPDSQTEDELQVRISAKALDKIFRAVNELAVGLLRLRTQNDDILARSNSLSALDQVAMQRLADIEQRVTLKGLGRSTGAANLPGRGPLTPLAVGRIDPDLHTHLRAGTAYALNAQTDQSLQAGFDALELDRYNELTGATQALNEAIDDMRGARDALVPSLREISVLTQRQLDIAREARFQLAQARLRPLSGLRARMRRTVRQTASAVGREAMLEIAGDDLRVDAAVLGPLSEALLHLLRNCVDHGLETPQERAAAGKPAQGTIRVAFASLGSGVAITISDDGRGLDHEAILNKALWSGLVPSDAKLSNEEIGRLIFLPGFSTRNAVTETSGRGVGLDAVAQAVASLQGSVGVKSVAGAGTEFRLFVLSSIGTVHALHLEAGGEHFLVPSTQLERVDAAPFLLDLQLDAVPESPAVVTQSLLQLLHGSGARGDIAIEALRALPSLVINVDGTQRRIAVDRIIEAREYLTSPVPALIDRMPGVSGVATLADGSLALVLDLIDLSRKPLPVQPQGLQQLAASVQEQVHILVTDDSASVRNTLSALLRDENYRITTARDGLDAMRIMQDTRFSLVLTDLEMPQANGFELTEFIRNRSSQRTVPVVMLTSRGQDKHRERALAVGVDAFLVKPYSDEGLLQTIHKALSAVPHDRLQNGRSKDSGTQDNAGLDFTALRAPFTRNINTTARGFE